MQDKGVEGFRSWMEGTGVCVFFSFVFVLFLFFFWCMIASYCVPASGGDASLLESVNN